MTENNSNRSSKKTPVSARRKKSLFGQEMKINDLSARVVEFFCFFFSIVLILLTKDLDLRTNEMLLIDDFIPRIADFF